MSSARRSTTTRSALRRAYKFRKANKRFHKVWDFRRDATVTVGVVYNAVFMIPLALDLDKAVG